MKIGTGYFYNQDCMGGMKEFPDKYFDLALVDPPYGIGKDGQRLSFCRNSKHNRKEHLQKNWDDAAPDKKYFDELFRVSKNQIIWGANYYPQYLPPSMGWIFWDKGQDLNQSDGELAFSSFNVALRRKMINRIELLIEGTIHPTQKPIKLYKWLLTKYANPGDKILDTHVGSASSIIAFIDLGFEFIGYEIDKDYYDSAMKRIENYLLQEKLF